MIGRDMIGRKMIGREMVGNLTWKSQGKMRLKNCSRHNICAGPPGP